MKKCRLFSLSALFLAVLMVFAACGEEKAQPRTLLASYCVEQFVGGTAITLKTENTYDEQGLLTQVVTYSGDVETSRATVENDEFGNPIRQASVSNGSTTISEIQNTYDKNGILTKKTDTITTDGIVTTRREYTYTEEGNPLTAAVTYYGETTSILSSSYEYDENGNVTTEIQEYNGDVTRTDTEYEYDEDNLILKAVKKEADGTVSSYTEYLYDENGNSIQQHSYSADGTAIGSTFCTYDESGNLLQQEIYSGETLVYRMTYTYIQIG